MSPGEVRVFAPAKVNLALHVTGRRADGYHLLDSFVGFLDVGDVVTAALAPDYALRVEGPFSEGVPDGPENLVLRAAQAAGRPARFVLEKHLPMAAGLGGGSSDAAAALRALERLGVPLPADTLALGADVPACLLARPLRMRGIGERITPLPPLPPIHLVLANPGVAVATPLVFGALASTAGAPLPALIPDFADGEALAHWLCAQRNDLQPAALRLAPAIGEVLAALAAAPGCRFARMSGSGATCFGLFPDRETAAQAARRLAAKRPRWWVVPAGLLTAPPTCDASYSGGTTEGSGQP